MVSALKNTSGTILRLVGKERDARLVAISEAETERNLRTQVEQRLAEESAECERLEKELTTEREGRLVAEARLKDAMQTIELLQATKPAPMVVKPDPAIPRIEQLVKELASRPAPVLNMTGMTFEIRRDEFGKPKQIVLKEK